MAAKYTTVRGFWEYLGYNETVLDFAVGKTPERETVALANVVAGDYYLAHPAVNGDTLKLYAGSTLLTETTHYTFDSDTSKVTITSSGSTALSGEDLTAEYEHCRLGRDLTYNQSVSLLERAEKQLDRSCNTVFADYTANDPGYVKIIEEPLRGGGYNYVHYKLKSAPIVKLSTTLSSSYTTGGTTISLTDATGFPSSGTIYIGGNKVSYTAKSSNDITVPATTPSIDNGAVVRGEVIEISTAASGTNPSYTVLTPDTDYEINYNTGEVQLQRDAYLDDIGIDNIDKPAYGVMDRFRGTYMSAWHELDQNPEIPVEIVETVYAIASMMLMRRTIYKANTGQRDNFSPGVLDGLREDIDSSIEKYRVNISGRA